ncbi:MAG: DUF5717 family protein [Clostridiales bacterium]|nr:DUF5717 family protein [Clostridiales bacterium]
MREKINRLARGIVDRVKTGLIVRPLSMEAAVLAGGISSGELSVSDADGGYIKGLVYSSNVRVKVKNDSFGGVRNRIAFEVDSRHLSCDDEIAGEFYLVTDDGETRIPYRFAVQFNQSGMTLRQLKSAKDFADIVRSDPDMGLRLFTFEDFVEAPFMQDPHIRILYDGLKKRPDRRNSLEEFLVTLKQKQPVELVVSVMPRKYRADAKKLEDVVKIRCSTWGYVHFEVSADGDFLKLPKTSFSQEDFTDGVCTVSYQIDPARLHGGHNLGSLHIDTVRDARIIPIEVKGISNKDANRKKPSYADLSSYMAMRLQYETQETKDPLLMGQMRKKLDAMYERFQDTLTIALMDAELALTVGDSARAADLLDARKGEMAERRQEKYVEYCYYTYMQIQLNGQAEQRDALLHLVDRYRREEISGSLFLLWVQLDPSVKEKPMELLAQMRHYFSKGCHSPFFYLIALELFENHPDTLRQVNDFELQVLVFGVRRGLLTRELALKAAQIAAESRRFDQLACRLLILMYETFKDRQFLSAVCAMLIKGHCRGPGYFHWYEEALTNGVSLTGLYEYYLYTLPKDYPYLLPREVLLYFSYGKPLDDNSRALLYMNILKYMKKDAPLYAKYEKEISEFTMDQLLRCKVNRRLVVLYEEILYKEMIDRKVARVLPSILSSYRIRVKNPNMKYVIVCYEELNEEDAYPIQDGIAYVPLYLEQNVILFQDSFGNRFYHIPFRKTPAMEKMDVEEMTKRCYEVFPDHPMLRLRESREILERGISSQRELEAQQKTLDGLPLHPTYSKMIFEEIFESRLRRFEAGGQMADEDAAYLLKINPDSLTREQRARMTEALIDGKYDKEAWGLVEQYGCEGISDNHLEELCSFQILHQTPPDSEELLAYSCQLFLRGKFDSVILDFLCEHYDGSGDIMYSVLEKGMTEQVEVYDMAERLLAQMLFCGDSDRMDAVFEWYSGVKQPSDSLIRAYYTKKSANYFLDEKPVPDKVFAHLEGYLTSAGELRKLPAIWLLAVGLYYSRLPVLDHARKELCSRILEVLLAEGRVFAWFQTLGRMVALPASIMDQTILEYRCQGEESPVNKPMMMIRILPEETEFHPEEMKRVYAGIYVMQKVLFAGEKLEYRISENRNGQDEVTQEGTLTPDPERAGTGSRYAKLNDICVTFYKKEKNCEEKMKTYLAEYLIREELFPLM